VGFGILSSYQGKILSRLVKIALTFSLPITLTALRLCTDCATCLALLGYLALQLAYLRWSYRCEAGASLSPADRHDPRRPDRPRPRRRAH
jgi:hypothetical protein